MKEDIKNIMAKYDIACQELEDHRGIIGDDNADAILVSMMLEMRSDVKSAIYQNLNQK